MARDRQSQAMDMYMRRMYRVIMILAPFFCLVAGILFSSFKALGFYPDVPLAPLVVFDCTCVAYCVIGAVLCYGCIDENDKLHPAYFNVGKWFVIVSLVIQWNFISYLFPAADFWAFLPFFLIAVVVFLDPKSVVGYSILLLASTFISWAIRPDVYLAANSAYFVPDLFLRVVSLLFITLALSVVTYIIKRICVTDVTNALVDEAEKESLIDAMTRLNNRKAYYIAYDSIVDPERLGVVFADVNSLKYTNDNLGHAAGDRLIIDFSIMLSVHFRRSEIFRISGDEFIVLCQNIDKETFDQRVDAIQEQLLGQIDPVATIGAAYGRISRSETISAAEHEMYERKAEYYTKHPEKKR